MTSMTREKQPGRAIVCDQCQKPMVNLGNVSGIVYDSLPQQWDEVYACHNCKRKRNVRVMDEPAPSFTFLDEYTPQ
jgi:hypothetical protein